MGALLWLKFVPTAVTLVEKLIKGKGRGREKKEVATEIITELVKDLPTDQQPSLKEISEEIEAVVPHVREGGSPIVLDTSGPVLGDNTIIDIHIRVTLDQIVDLVKRGVFR